MRFYAERLSNDMLFIMMFLTGVVWF